MRPALLFFCSWMALQAQTAKHVEAQATLTLEGTSTTSLVDGHIRQETYHLVLPGILRGRQKGETGGSFQFVHNPAPGAQVKYTLESWDSEGGHVRFEGDASLAMSLQFEGEWRGGALVVDMETAFRGKGTRLQDGKELPLTQATGVPFPRGAKATIRFGNPSLWHLGSVAGGETMSGVVSFEGKGAWGAGKGRATLSLKLDPGTRAVLPESAYEKALKKTPGAKEAPRKAPRSAR